MAMQYQAEGADELVLLDISATKENREIVLSLIKKVAQNINIPFTVGGGIKTLQDIENVFNAGADKVSIGSAAVKTPELIGEASRIYGKERIVLAIDAKARKNGCGWTVHIKGGDVDTGIDLIKLIIDGERRGAGEILLTSMDADGTKNGFDNKLYAEASGSVKIPIIASGGAGCMQHFYNVIAGGGVNGVLAASLFHFGEIKIINLKKFLNEKGISVNWEDKNDKV